MSIPTAVADESTTDSGFTLIELLMAALVMTIVMTSLTFVLTNALVDTAYARQRNVALNIANQTVEELRALPWSTVEAGLASTDLAGDANISSGCFDAEPLDVGGAGVTSGTCPSPPPAWHDPSCLSNTGLAAPLTASALVSPAPLYPHQACSAVGGTNYGVDVYVTWVEGTAVPPVSATVVVSWNRGLRKGLDQRVVTTTQISNCNVGVACNAST